MPVIDLLYSSLTVVLVIAGLTIVGLALRAYRWTTQRAFIHLAVGFTLIVAAAGGTAISAFVLSFQTPRSLLVVHNSMAAVGYLFVIYSLFSYDQQTAS